ncbi:MAG: ABC transporter ATP-binding protein [Akkermansiaceae bacterium]|jgi:ABC-2 type transport system ATP-binding protein
MSAISFKKVSKFFKGKCAISTLSMEVPEGKVTAFLGPNGAGKTTAIKLMLGLDTPSEGEITVRGTSSAKLGAKEFESIGYVSENQKLPLWMTVQRYLDFCRPLYPSWDPDLEARLLAQYQLPMKSKLKALSRGQLMKVSLLSNLAFRPKLIVLDEPFSGLDPLVRDELIEGLLELSESESWTVFISSHDIEEIERLADHVAIIKNGILQSSESTDSLLARFRRVIVPIKENAAIPEKISHEWFGIETSGRFLTFTHDQWNDEALQNLKGELAEVLDGEVKAGTLSLRDILVALSKNPQLKR